MGDSKYSPEHFPLREAYTLLHASSPGELTRKFITEDQNLLKARTWNYTDRDLTLNKVKEVVESTITTGFTTGDKEGDDDLKTILWFWYHHATGYAIWGHKDKPAALEFSSKALRYQTTDNPNKITRLLYPLVRDRAEEAAALLETIINESEKTASRGILEEYLDGNFFR